MTNVRYIQTHPKLLLGVLNCIRLCGFHKIARGVAELLLLEVFYNICRLMNLEF